MKGRRTHSWGRLGFRKGSLSAPFTAFVLRCFGSEFVAGAWELLDDGGFLLANSFLCLSISSRCWFSHSCCLWKGDIVQIRDGEGKGYPRCAIQLIAMPGGWSIMTLGREECSKGNHVYVHRWTDVLFFSYKLNGLIQRDLLDEVLKGVAVRPLLRERGPVAHRGEVSKTQPVLHALLPARLLLLGALEPQQNVLSTRTRSHAHAHTRTHRHPGTHLLYKQLLAHTDAFIQAFLKLFK